MKYLSILLFVLCSFDVCPVCCTLLFLFVCWAVSVGATWPVTQHLNKREFYYYYLRLQPVRDNIALLRILRVNWTVPGLEPTCCGREQTSGPDNRIRQWKLETRVVFVHHAASRSDIRQELCVYFTSSFLLNIFNTGPGRGSQGGFPPAAASLIQLTFTEQ